MVVKRGIVVLGSGPEIEFLVHNLVQNTDISLLAYGPSNEIELNPKMYEYCLDQKIPIVSDHYEALKYNPKFIFMMSYAPLILNLALICADL